MKAIHKKGQMTPSVFSSFCKLAVIALTVFALVMLPYKVDFHKGSLKLKSTVLLADDDGGHGDGDGDGGHDGDDGGDDGDHDGDDGGYDGDDSDHDGDDGEDHDGDHDSDDDGDHDGDHDGEDSDDHHSDENKSSHNDSSDSDSSPDSNDKLFDVGGMQGLKEVSSEDEASLVGNWEKSSTE